MPRSSLSLRERLLKWIPDPLPPEAECWIWQGCTNERGYGRIQYKGKARAAHRMSFTVFNGIDLIQGLVVMHSCYNPPCINPQHLTQGTYTPNTRMMYEAGRATHKSMSDEDYRAIYHDKRPYRVIAKEYNTSHGNVCRIKQVDGYCVQTALQDLKPIVERYVAPPAILRAIYSTPGSTDDLATLFGVSVSVIYKVKQLKTRNARRAILGEA